MDETSCILFCRCYLDFTSSAPLESLDGILDDHAAEAKLRELALAAADGAPELLTSFVETFNEDARKLRARSRARALGQPTPPGRAVRRRPSAAGDRPTKELTVEEVRADLRVTLRALGWRSPRKRSLVIMGGPGGHVGDPLWQPTFLLTDVSSLIIGQEVVAALLQRMPDRIAVGPPYGETMTTVRFGTLLAADLGAPGRAATSIELSQLVASVPTPPLSELPDLRASRYGSPARLSEALVVHARLLADVLREDATASSATSPAGESARNEFRKEGSMWRISFEGKQTILPGLRGLQHLQELVRAQGNGVHVLELSPDSGGGAAPAPLLDARAKKEYEDRLSDLRATREEALESNDALVVKECDEETASIEGELRKAGAYGGRDRTTGDRTESARSRVASAIRKALATLKVHHPDLHAHFVEHLHAPNGLEPMYSPPDEVQWLL